MIKFDYLVDLFMLWFVKVQNVCTQILYYLKIWKNQHMSANSENQHMFTNSKNQLMFTNSKNQHMFTNSK
jgi:hypothetical protein